MPAWIEYAARLGAPSVMVLILCWFLFRDVWRHMTTQISHYQSVNSKLVEEFMRSVAARDSELAHMREEISRLREQLTEHMARFKG